MSYAYLVTEKATGKKRLVAASSPSVAISAVAGEAYETQRVEGFVLDTLKETLGEPLQASKPREANGATTAPAEQDKATAKS